MSAGEIHLGFAPVTLNRANRTIEAVLADVDAVIVTHTHSDHWDSVAQQQIPKDMPIFVQNEADANKLAARGFTQIERLEDTETFQGVELRKISR